MVLVIPMSGMGKRFVSVGYTKPKPLLLVDGRPIIAHVLDMFPGENNVVFICNNEHLETTNMKDVLLELRPSAKIVSIEPHNKGPVYAIQQAYDHIPDTAEVMVSYCDYTCRWDYGHFKNEVRRRSADGAIPSYIGFHPHLLGKDFYGHMLWDDDDWMIEIKEKESYTDDKMQEYGAVGAYWFRTGALMKKYFDEAFETNLKTGKEFFCSLPYNLLVRDGYKVWIPSVQTFCQWGTPQDLEEYEAWSRQFAEMSGKKKGKTDIPKSREKFVQKRQTAAENQHETFSYWREYFASVDWHPYQ